MAKKGKLKYYDEKAKKTVLIIAVVTALSFVLSIVLVNPYLFMIGIIGVLVLSAYMSVTEKKIKKEQGELLNEIKVKLQNTLNISSIDAFISEYDDRVVVKSRQALDGYTDLKYFKETNALDNAKEKATTRMRISKCISHFLQNNDYKENRLYDYVAEELERYIKIIRSEYKVLVSYVTASGNNVANNMMTVSLGRLNEIAAHPEYLMSKGEYNKFLKQQEKEALEEKKKSYYEKVNAIIDFANSSKEELVVKSKANELDTLIQSLFDRTINSIQKIKELESEEWEMIGNFISSISDQVTKLVEDDKKISDYYASDDFAKIKETCDNLTQSRKDFNEYIEEKAESISKLFGTRVSRNETETNDEYNYVRAYKKSITPFTAEVSSTVFGSAENNPMDYVIKYFYPNKSQYKSQIEKLQLLIEELETLKEAKEIIENYKKDYDEYIQNVPEFVLKNDEDGFYKRLGLAVIDEAVLNVEYKFAYTSDGGMAQRSFTVPMNEENITELINRLESKLTTQALAKEQRALMTSKLRTQIKERDNYTCCQCGNSTHAEPNLLLEIDHIIPIAKGGLTKEDNLQTLCWKCNRSKGSKLITA